MKEIVAQRDDLAKKLAKMELELSKKNNELLEKTKENAQAKRKHSYQIMEKDEKIANKNKIIEDFDTREETLKLENARRDFALAASIAKKDEVLDELIRENSDLIQENREFREKIAQDKMVEALQLENVQRDFALADLLTKKDDVMDELIRDNSKLVHENKELRVEINESVEILQDKAKMVEALKLENARRDLALADLLTEKDDVMDELIRDNSKLVHENKELRVEIKESVEIAKEKDELVVKLAQENNEKDVVLDEVIRENWVLAQENQDLIEEIAQKKDLFVVKIAQENYEKDVVLDEVIRENYELSQERKDLVEEINERIHESVEIAQEKGVILNELIRENWELAQENQDLIEKVDEGVEIAYEKDIVLDELIREKWELAQVKGLVAVEEVADKEVEELEIELKFELRFWED